MQQNYKPKAEKQSQESKLSKLVDLAHVIENLEVKNHGFILILMLSRTFLEIVLPSFLLLISQKFYVGGFQKQYLQIFLKQVTKEQNQNILEEELIIQLCLLIIFSSVLLVLFYSRSYKIRLYTLQALTIFYYIWGFFILREVNILYNLLLRGQSITEVKLLCVVNICLGVFLAVLYKALAHSHAPVLPNSLCSRHGVLETVGSAVSKIVTVLVLAQIMEQKYFGKDGESNEAILIVCEFALLGNALLRLSNFGLKLGKQVQSFTHAEPFAEKIYRNCLALELSCLLMTLLCLLTKVQLLTDNYFYAGFSFYFFFYFTLDRFLESRSRAYKLKTQGQVKTSNEAILFIRELNKIFLTNIKNAEQMESHMIKDLYRNHEESCLEVGCFCKDADLTCGRDEKNKDKAPLYQLLALKIMQRLCQTIVENNGDVIKFVLWTKLKIHHNFMGISVLQKSQKFKKLKKAYFSKAFFHKYSLQIRKMFSAKESSLNLTSIEKILESDDLAERIIDESYKVVESKATFWNNLAKGAVNQQFEAKVKDELELLKELNKFTQVVLTYFQNNCFLLSLIMSYQRSILLKERISKELVSCLTKLQVSESKNNFKMSEKRNEPSLIEKIMYSNSCCSIQISMNDEQLGMIVSVSKKTKAIFKYEERSLIGANINKIMPSKMQAEHNHILRTWTRTCSWANVGKLKEVYCVDSQNVCFAGKLQIKPIQRLDSVNAIGLFVKENDQDYLIIDDSNLVISAGKNFINTLGSKILNMPLDFICESPELIQKWAKENGKTNRRLDFYSTKTNSKIFDAYHEKHHNNGLTTPAKGQCITNKILEMKSCQLEKVSLLFSVGKFQFGRLGLKYIKLADFHDYSKRQTQRRSLNLICPERTSQLMPETESFAENQSKMFLNFNPSINSSHQDQTISTFNILSKLEKLFYSKEKMNDRRVSKTVLILSLLCATGFFVDFFKVAINESGYDEIEELLLADSSCSDNLQFSMIIYNKALIVNSKSQTFLSSYEASSVNNGLLLSLKTELEELKYEQNYLNNLITSQVLKYQKSLTSLNQIHMFEYQRTLVKWVDTHGKQLYITTFHFIENFLYFCGQISELSTSILEKGEKKMLTQIEITKLSTELQFYVDALRVNFEELEKINQDNLDSFEKLQRETKSSIETYTYVKMSIAISTMFLLLVFLNSYLKYRENQAYKISEIYKYITQDSAMELFWYYRKLSKLLRTHISLNKKKENIKNSNVPFEKDQLLQKINEVYQQQYNQKQQNRQFDGQKNQGIKLSIQKVKSSKMKIIFVFIFFCVVGLNVLIQISQSTILDRSQEIIILVNDLIQSENEIISAYLSEKSYDSLNQQQLQHLLTRINNVEVEFTNLVVQSFALFLNFDPNFESRLTQMLTQNVCELTKDLIPQHYQKCLKDKDMKIARTGIVNEMNYFNREFANFLLEDIKSGVAHTAYRTFALEKVDKAFLHMFKVFEIIQGLIINSLKIKISNQKIEFMFYMSLELAIFFSIALYCKKFYKSENRKSSDRVGRILLLPVRMIKNETKILKNFQTAVDYFNIQNQ